MQHVSAVTHKAITSKNSQHSQTGNALSSGRVKRIFSLMQAYYGSRWVQQTGTGKALDLSRQVWSQKLAGLSDRELMHGLDNLPNDYPPTPGRFKEICKEYKSSWSAYRMFPKELPRPRNKEMAKAAIADIRKIMARG